MKTVGLTGGIGSGKTTVAGIWKHLGAQVLFADDLAKDLMQTDPDLKEQLIAVFGPDTFAPDGSLNKKYLISEAFQKNRVEELNAVVHPAIRKKTEELIRKAEREGTQLFVYEAAILLNEGRPDYVDHVVLVISDRKKRVKRVLKRDNVKEEDVVDRMSKQPDFEHLTHLADDIIENNGTLHELEKAASDLYQKLIGNH